MSFDADQTIQQVTESIGAMLLLHSSCQALIEVAIAPSNSPWYPVLDQELGTAEDLVVGWRQNGYLYFQQAILIEIGTCGQAFLGARSNIDSLFKELSANFTPALQNQIVSAISALEAPVNGMINELTAYGQKLAVFEQALEIPNAQMNTSIAEIQAQEAEIQEQITAINAQIAALQQQVATDRVAISKARAARDRGIVETIFGILLAPFTGGVSLILAGIGVGTIAEAEEQVSALETSISGFQSTIVGDQTTLTTDQQQVATLQGLTMSMALALGDVKSIDSALDALRTSWGVLLSETLSAASDVQNAKTATDAIVGQVWFDAACNSWQSIVNFVQQMAGNQAPVPTQVTIGLP